MTENAPMPRQDLATRTTAAFTREQRVGAGEAPIAWTAASQTEETARRLLTRRGRAS